MIIAVLKFQVPVNLLSLGDMTKMAAMVIDSKIKIKICLCRTRKPTILKLGMKHRVMELYNVYHYANLDPGMTMTYFIAS